MQITKKYIAVIISVGCTIIHAQDTLRLNLEQCREMAIQNSETIKIADETINKASGEKTAARSAWLPNISASANGIYNNTHIEEELYLPTQVYDPSTGQLVPNVVVDPSTGNPVIGPDGNPVFNSYAYLPLDLTIYGGALAGISVEQPLYAGGKIIAGNKMASIGENMAVNNKQLKKSEIIYETDQTYYLYLSIKEKVILAKKYQQLLDELVKVVNNSYETGMTNRNELLKVQVKYNEATLQVQKAQTGLELARMSLCRIIGLALDSPVEIDDSIGTTISSAGSENMAIVTNRIEYKLLQDQVEIAEQNIKMVRGNYLPVAGIAAGYNHLVIGLEDADNYTSQGMSVMVSLKIPITHFGERKGKIKAARAEYNMRQLELQQAEELLHLEIEQARLNYNDAYTRVEIAHTALEQADENMRISDDNYNLGMEPIVNLLEAKAEWQNAYSNLIDALTDFKVKESNLLRVTNKLNVE